MKEGEPKDENKYFRVEINGMILSIDKRLKFKNESAAMDLRRFLLTYEITIEGVDITF